jgi:DNA repair protein RadC
MKALKVADRKTFTAWGNIQSQLEPTQYYAELISTVLGGSKIGQTIIDRIFAGAIPASPQATLDLLRTSLTTDRLHLGLTAKQYAKLQAALELGKRIGCPDIIPQSASINDPKIAANLLMGDIGYESVEHFAILVLNVKYQVIVKQIVSIGTASETIAHPREIFRTTIHHGGHSCIVAHNHPSGSLQASPEDILLTQQLIEAGKILAIEVLDHLILSHGNFVSLRETTALWEQFTTE